MAHFAEITPDGIVTRVLVVPNEHEGHGQTYLADDLGLGGTWVQTSYNTRGGVHANGGTPFRGNYAGIGYLFDPDFGPDGAFIPPQPFLSWVLNPDTALWQAPVPYPSDGGVYDWDEPTLSWVEVV